LTINSAIVNGVVSRDSGVFLYVGQQVLAGHIPYADAWDHKGPIIYYVDALGLALAGGSPFGVVALEWVALSVAALIGFAVIRRHFGAAVAWIATIGWLAAAPPALNGGNFTEEFALPLQFFSLRLIPKSERERAQTRRWLLVGASIALCFMLKPNLIGLPACVAAASWVGGLGSGKWRLVLASLGATLAGTTVTMLPVAAYFAARGAFGSMVDQVVRFNLAYSGATSLSWVAAWDRVNLVQVGLDTLAASPLPWTALLGWIVAIASLRFQPQKTTGQTALLAVAILDLPVELGLTWLSGRTYEHEFLTWLPVMTVLTAILLNVLIRSSHGDYLAQPLRPMVPAALVALATVAAALPVLTWIGRLSDTPVVLSRSYQFYSTSQTVGTIPERANPSDEVLVWGAETSLNFLSGRRSPTRYAYQYPFYVAGYQSAAELDEFLRDLRANKPRLIVDTSATNFSIPPVEPGQRADWLSHRASLSEFHSQLLPQMATVFSYIQTHYVREAQVENSWVVYRLADDIVGRTDVAPSVAVDDRLGSSIIFRGYDRSDGANQANHSVRLTLYWEAADTPSVDYTVFVHLESSTGTLVSQVDSPPLKGRYPTSLWQRGEAIRDAVELPLPAQLPPGAYYVRLGMYDLRTMQRLAVRDRSGRDLGNSIDTGSVTVGGA
jgi:hypothetical protein